MPINHVQVTCPPNGVEHARTFYTEVVGFTEIEQPDMVAGRGGFWVGDDTGCEIHVGIEEDFRPQRKGHPALDVRDLDAVAGRLAAAGHPVEWAPADEVPGWRRFHTTDPAGNRLEFLSPA
jgi:predicted enzyme related to lactoylglutathione lyase